MNINIELPPEQQNFIKLIQKKHTWVTQEYVSLFAPSNTTKEGIFTIKVVLALMGLLHDEYKLIYDEYDEDVYPDKDSRMSVQDVLAEYLNNN